MDIKNTLLYQYIKLKPIPGDIVFSVELGFGLLVSLIENNQILVSSLSYDNDNFYNENCLFKFKLDEVLCLDKNVKKVLDINKVNITILNKIVDISYNGQDSTLDLSYKALFLISSLIDGNCNENFFKSLVFSFPYDVVKRIKSIRLIKFNIPNFNQIWLVKRKKDSKMLSKYKRKKGIKKSVKYELIQRYYD